MDFLITKKRRTIAVMCLVVSLWVPNLWARDYYNTFVTARIIRSDLFDMGPRTVAGPLIWSYQFSADGLVVGRDGRPHDANISLNEQNSSVHVTFDFGFLQLAEIVDQLLDKSPKVLPEEIVEFRKEIVRNLNMSTPGQTGFTIVFDNKSHFEPLMVHIYDLQSPYKDEAYVNYKIILSITQPEKTTGGF